MAASRNCTEDLPRRSSAFRWSHEEPTAASARGLLQGQTEIVVECYRRGCSTHEGFCVMCSVRWCTALRSDSWINCFSCVAETGFFQIGVGGRKGTKGSSPCPVVSPGCHLQWYLVLILKWSSCSSVMQAAFPCVCHIIQLVLAAILSRFLFEKGAPRAAPGAVCLLWLDVAAGSSSRLCRVPAGSCSSLVKMHSCWWWLRWKNSIL